MIGAPDTVPRGDPRVTREPRPRRDVHGVLIFDKPLGLTSNQALQRVKWLYQARKAGHTGSLDPLASGMLPLCFGEATKFAGYLLDAEKTYRVRARFGVRTDTGDAEGAAVATGPEQVSAADLERAIARFRGTISQVPPMYSALKHQGRRLYALARAGEQVERPPRQVEIAELLIEEADPQQPVLRVRCSKGTYIRTLVEDIAASAGTVGHVVELRRLAVGPFTEPALVSMATLERCAGAGPGGLDVLLLDADGLLQAYPAVYLGATEAGAIRQGQPVRGAGDPGLVRLYDAAARFIGLGEVVAGGRLEPRRLVAERL